MSRFAAIATLVALLTSVLVKGTLAADYSALLADPGSHADEIAGGLANIFPINTKVPPGEAFSFAAIVADGPHPGQACIVNERVAENSVWNVVGFDDPPHRLIVAAFSSPQPALSIAAPENFCLGAGPVRLLIDANDYQKLRQAAMAASLAKLLQDQADERAQENAAPARARGQKASEP